MYNDPRMPISDVVIVCRFWGAIFLLGAAAYPLTRRLFPTWHDQGYLLSKAVGLSTVTWIVYVLGMAKILPFTVSTVLTAVGIVFGIGLLLESFGFRRLPAGRNVKWGKSLFVRMSSILAEELFFLLALVCWSWVKAHEPSIRGLEKFMDYGFMQSILNSRYFPPADMWYPPYPVNYYYFGHLVTAVLTRLSGLDLSYTFNLMLATIFSLCFTMSFSIGAQLFRKSSDCRGENDESGSMIHHSLFMIMSGLITAILVTLAGNMQTIYAFTRGYTGDEVRPIWDLLWKASEFWQRLPEGMERYWYANATRFIPYTIHEFPSYSFVVSDVHGHVLSIPFVLLAIALLIHFFGTQGKREEGIKSVGAFMFYGFLVGVLLMTNALDGPIYLGLFLILFGIFHVRFPMFDWKKVGVVCAVIIGTALMTSLPFLAHFKSFVNGVAVNCPLPFFANIKIGPIMFEGIEKCQRSPFWMVWILWGFFWYCGFGLVAARVFTPLSSYFRKGISFGSYLGHLWKNKFTQIEKILLIFVVFSTLLIIFPELFYFKDIYPQHFRSNTMFKLGYQAFILLSIASGYTISQFLFQKSSKNIRFSLPSVRKIFLLLLLPQIFLVLIFPTFSVRSYFGALRKYEGLNGLTWLMREYPDDSAAIFWLKSQNVNCQQLRGNCQRNALVEADGDSYTDYERFSVFTGMPTPIGWAVHEWLWRGTYDVVAPRREDVRYIYESDDIEKTRDLLDTYNVRYIVVGSLERQKFTKMQEEKFTTLGSVVFQSGETVVYERAN